MAEFVHGELAAAVRERVDDHIATCGRCRRAVAALARELPAAPGGALARYRIDRVLGQGGMGVVVAAHDLELDRPVAIKLARSGHGTDDARARLVREARALAQLSHPNVITIYDAGIVEGELYIAMELVEGGTLREWLVRERRSWRQIVDVFVAAGRGLAAAHSAGLVHRDFKPSNVLMGADARPRVSDFGLVRLAGQPGTAQARAAGWLAVGSPVTQTSNVLGTPHYMAPEQREGRTTDARGDQYSFCVALYEALYGVHPAAPADHGPAREHKVPSWIRRIVVRGCADDPAARWPTMDALLFALGRDRRAAIWRWAVAGLVAALVAVGAVALRRAPVASADSQTCRGAERKLVGIWDPSRRQAVRAAFAAAAGQTAWPTVDRIVETYAGAWTAMHTEACEATRVRGEQSERVLDLRIACLDQRRMELAALVDVFALADAKVVANAADAARALPRLDGCGDVAGLTATVPPPEDPAIATRIEATRARLAQVRALERTGKYREALAAAKSIVETSVAIRYAPLAAEAHAELGQLSSDVGDYAAAEQGFRAALLAAEAGRHELVRLRALTKLGRVVGIRLARLDDGLHLVQQAEAALAPRRTVDELHVRVFETMGALLAAQGKPEAAAAYLERAVDAAEDVFQPDDRDLGDVLLGHATVLWQLGRFEDSSSYVARARGVWERSLGPDHPELARVATLNGDIELARGDLSKAEAHYLRSLQLWEHAFGAEHPDLSVPLNNLGVVAEARKDYEAAARYQARGLAVIERALGPDHPDLIGSLTNLGSIALARHRYRDALGNFERAVSIGERRLGRDHPGVGPAVTGVGLARLGLRGPVAAIPSLERAVVVLANAPPGGAPATARFALARALWDSARDRGRARALAREARDLFAHEGPLYQANVDEVDGWLAGHGAATRSAR